MMLGLEDVFGSICLAGTLNLPGWNNQFAGLGWSICRARMINLPGSYNQFSGLLWSICWARTKSHNGLGKESANYLGLDENNVAWRVSPSWSKPGGPQNRHRVDWPALEGWLCTLKLVLQFSTTQLNTCDLYDSSDQSQTTVIGKH